jgi:UDP-N-acetylglucosamine--N-acetylmuramyl-(pentapeptide) pyrophosphoryl-undecaprenol N-acetylglucosamine transferase
MSLEPKKKLLILTGGGTAGHVTPNLALIPKLEELEVEIFYVGRKSGIERGLLEKTDVPYYGISAGKLRRYFDLRNISDIFLVGAGFVQSFFLLRKLRPQVVFSKGGFVSCPLVWAAWLNRMPVIIHESDLTPGLANKLSAPFAERICYSFPETAPTIPPEKAVFSGIPIRESLLRGQAAKGRGLCSFTDSKPVVLVSGGSQGAESINKTVRTGLDQLLTQYNLCHICGQGSLDAALEARPGYKQFEFVDEEWPHLLAMADMVVTRAGATTIFELVELRKPNLLIPLTLGQSRGDQILNAQSFEKRGFSKVLMEDDLSVEILVEGVSRVYTDRALMIDAMEAAGSVNGTDKVIDEIMRYFDDQGRM